MARVFISHASDDGPLADQVLCWLVDAGHEVFLDSDLRTGLAVGEHWPQRLYERLRWADAVVCLITPAYLVSTWCAAELGIASSRGSLLLPLRSGPGLTHPLLADAVQYADLGDPAAARARLGAALARLDATGGRGWPDGRSPFPGLLAFGADLHQVFFGRHGEVQELAGRLRSPAERAEPGLLVVVGPSGCGKSSVVRAGLVPLIAGEQGWWVLPPVLPGADPVGALARELAGEARKLGLDWGLSEVRERLAGGLVPVAEELLLATPGGGGRRRLLVILDQAEELLNLGTPEQRAELAGLLEPALAGPVQVVATLRPEFLAPLLASPELAGLSIHTFTLRPLAREVLPTVIEEPARLAGLHVEPDLVARLVADTGTGEALPLLAFTLAQLATGLDRGDRLSFSRYQELGGVRGALARQADAALAEAAEVGGRTPEEVIAGLLSLVTVDEQGRPVRWRVPLADLPEPVLAEVDAFVGRRLMTTDAEDGEVVIGMAHEAFLSAWPPLAAAVGAAGAALRARRAVEQAAGTWDAAGRPHARLWERGQLAAAVSDLGAHLVRGQPGLVAEAIELGPRARAFLETSIRTDRRRRARGTVVLSVLLALALVTAGIAFVQRSTAQQQRRTAEEQQRIATARQLTTQADALLDSDPRTALLLGVAAQRIHDDGETQASLTHTLMNTDLAGALTGHTTRVYAVAFSPDRRTVATGGGDRMVRLWDVSDPTRQVALGSPLSHGNSVFSLAFSRDGRTLATGSADHLVRLWDLTDRAHPKPLGQPLEHDDAASALAFSPDGHTLVSGGYDHKVRLWDLTDRANPTALGAPLGLGGSVFSLAFSPDGRTLATADEDHTAQLWDMADRAHPIPVGPPVRHDGPVFSVAFSPSGHTVATGGGDKMVRLWDVTDRAHPLPLGPPLVEADLVLSVAFSPVGGLLAAAGYDQRVRLWDVGDRTHPTAVSQTMHQGDAVYSVAFSPDGRTLASASGDHTVLLWRLTDRASPAYLESLPQDGPVLSVAFSPDGRTLASGSADRTVRLWDLTDPARPTALGDPLPHNNSVRSVAFSPDGRTLATGGVDDSVRLWDLSDRTHPTPLGYALWHGNAVWSVAFSPDGLTLASASLDSTVRLWDLSDRTHPVAIGQPIKNDDAVWSVVFLPGGRTIATAGSDHTVRLWDLSDRLHPAPLGAAHHDGTVYQVAASPDGRTLAGASLDHTVRLWDVADNAHPTALGQPLKHDEAAYTVAFSPDGRTLATSGYDKTVRLWDVADRTHPNPLGRPLKGDQPVLSVAFSPDGRTLAVASGDHTVEMWDLSRLIDLRAHLTEVACGITGGGLDPAQWAHYITGLPYQLTCP